MSEKDISLPPYATDRGKKDEKDAHVLMHQDTDPEIAEGLILDEKGQLKQGLHQRHIQMIVGRCIIILSQRLTFIKGLGWDDRYRSVPRIRKSHLSIRAFRRLPWLLYRRYGCVLCSSRCW